MSEVQNQETEASTRDFLLKVIGYFKFLGKNWHILLSLLLIGSAYDLIKNRYSLEEKHYNGKIIFHLELEGNASQIQLGGLASSLGLGGTGGGDNNLLGATNFQAIALSINVFQKAFFTEIMFNGKKDLFINHFLTYSDFKKSQLSGKPFTKADPMIDYVFVKKPINLLTSKENELIRKVYTNLHEFTLINSVQNSNLFELYSATSLERLTKVWIEVLLYSIEDFYNIMRTKKTQQLLRTHKNRLDSLEYLLRKTDRNLARLQFENPNVVDPAGLYKEKIQARDNTFYSSQYGVELNTVEAINQTLIEQTPVFTILEPVTLPMEILEKTGITLRLSGLILLFLGIVILTIRRAFINVLKS